MADDDPPRFVAMDDRGSRRARCARPETIRQRHTALGRCLRWAERVTRGPVSVVVTVAFLVAAGAVGGRVGLVPASAWIAVLGTYCLANFWYCREAHCIVTGAGWAVVSALGFAAALAPGSSLSWYRPDVQSAAFLVILGAGYGLECVVVARTGRRAL